MANAETSSLRIHIGCTTCRRRATPPSVGGRRDQPRCLGQERSVRGRRALALSGHSPSAGLSSCMPGVMSSSKDLCISCELLDWAAQSTVQVRNRRHDPGQRVMCDMRSTSHQGMSICSKDAFTHCALGKHAGIDLQPREVMHVWLASPNCELRWPSVSGKCLKEH